MALPSIPYYVYLYFLYIGVYSSIILNFRQQFGLDTNSSYLLFVYYMNVYLYKISRILVIIGNY